MTAAGKTVYGALLTGWAGIICLMVRNLTAEIPNVIRMGRRVLVAIVVWTLATHLLTVITVPWAAVQVWRGRDGGSLLAGALAGNVLLCYVVVWVFVGTAVPTVQATIAVSGATLLALFVIALRRLLSSPPASEKGVMRHNNGFKLTIGGVANWEPPLSD